MIFTCRLYDKKTEHTYLIADMIFSPDTVCIIKIKEQDDDFFQNISPEEYIDRRSRVYQTSYQEDIEAYHKLGLDPRYFGRYSECVPVLYRMMTDFQKEDDDIILKPLVDTIYTMAGWDLDMGCIYIWRKNTDVPNEVR